MIHHSPLPPVVVPDVSVAEYVLGPARQRGDRVALLDAESGERLTYRELAEGAEAAAAGLARLGVRPGDVVGLMSHNQPRYALAVFAVLAAGATVAPVNPTLTVGELAKQLTIARARVLLTASAVADKAAGLAAAGVERIVVLDGPDFDMLVSGAGPAPRVLLDPRTAVAALPFSSGTTGVSKGVQLTHRNLVANVEQNRSGWCPVEGDVVTAILPFFHIYGFNVIMTSALRGGATLVTLPRFGLAPFLRMVQDHKVTQVMLVPPIVLALATAPEVDDYDLSSVRYAMSGAAPLDTEVAERAEKRLGCRIRQGYGMTEASPGTHVVPQGEAAAIPSGSIGRLLPNTECRLVDPVTGTDAAPGEPGELWVRGPQVMSGYLDNPVATAEALVDDGWLRTGDIARVDADGLFWIVDRLKELIKYKGFQIAPAELESVLLTHPDVLDAAVIGVPDPVAGETPKAFVVTARKVEEAALLDWVAERVASYKRIRDVEFVSTIPKSPAGKILRRQLAARTP